MIESVDRPVDVALAARIAATERFALLESGGPVGPDARFSVLALDPTLEIRAQDGEVTITALEGHRGATPAATGDGLLPTLAALHRARSRPPGGPPFACGIAGYVGYETLHEIEPSVPRSAAPPLGPPDALLHCFESAIVYDRLQRRAWLCGADERLPRLRELASAAERAPAQPPQAALPRLSEALIEAAGITSDTPADDYRALVELAKEHIRAGDVFELCVTRRFELPATTGDLYAALRAVNPAPMSAWLRSPRLEIASASPERLVRLDPDGNAETRPIKGTRPRDGDPQRDRELRDDLARAAKDRAEHVMIVDVARNDLGRVCLPGSIGVARLAEIEAHPTVWQMVSTVRGRLRPSRDALDLLEAVFPAASMTGAPKVQAMKLIAELERSSRGVYSGAIGFIDDGGAMDMNVVIRTLVRWDDRLTFHSGGAITSDSLPHAEEQETLDKAAALVRALALAGD